MSTLENFTNIFSTWLKNDAFPQICNYLANEKKIMITPEDLIKVLNLPSTPATANSAFAFGSVMGLTGGSNTTIVPNNSSTLSAPKSTGGRKKKAETDPNGSKCKYIYKKGNPSKIGQTCGDNSVAYDFCLACITKNDAITEMEKDGIDPEVIKGIRSMRVDKRPKADLRKYLNDISTLKSSSYDSSGSITQKASLVFYDLPEQYGKGLSTIKEIVPQAFFITDKSGIRVCHGKLKENNGNMEGPFALTPEEARLITSKGHQYVPPGEKQSTDTPVAAAVTHIPPSVHQVTSTITPPFSSTTSAGGSLQPPGVIMPPYMNSNAPITQMASHSIMTAVPEIMKIAADQSQIVM